MTNPGMLYIVKIMLRQVQYQDYMQKSERENISRVSLKPVALDAFY